MKKTFISMLMLAITTAGMAQTTIKAAFHEGETATYATTYALEAGVPMGGTQKMEATFDTQYTVKEVTTEGAVIDILVKKIETSGAQELANDEQLSGVQALQNITVKVSTTPEGALKHIVNYDEVKQKVDKYNTDLIEKLYQENPQIEQVQPKANMLKAVTEKSTEETLLQLIDVNGLFELYGKTLKTGDTEDKVEQGVKMKTTYTVATILGNLGVTAKSVANLSEEEVKALILQKMEESGLPQEQIEQVKANWGQLVAMGLAKVDIDSTTTTHFQKNGWPQDVTTENNTQIMGTDIKSKVSTKQTEKIF